MAGYPSNLAKKFSPTEQFPQHILPLLPLYNALWWGYESLTAIVLVWNYCTNIVKNLLWNMYWVVVKKIVFKNLWSVVKTPNLQQSAILNKTVGYLRLQNNCNFQQRNKPKQPPKAPKSAPFFLPTIAGLEPKFDLPQTDEGKDKVGTFFRLNILFFCLVISVFHSITICDFLGLFNYDNLMWHFKFKPFLSV